MVMDINKTKAIVEGLLLATGEEGVTVKQLSTTLGTTNFYMEHLLNELKKEYQADHRGITLMQSNNVFYLTTKPEHSDYLKKLLQTPQHTKLSQAALEVLAIIAYRQPITRVEIEEVRGVNSDRPLRTLLARSLIKELGRKDTVGKPILFGTTVEFLTYFGLVSLEELPPLPEMDEEDIEAEADLYMMPFKQIDDAEGT